MKAEVSCSAQLFGANMRHISLMIVVEGGDNTFHRSVKLRLSGNGHIEY
jgi:hypothetical protein